MKRIISFVIIILLFILVGCRQSGISEEKGIKVEDEKPMIDGQLNIACIEPISFNPIKNKNKSYQDITSLFFAGLFEYDKESKITPVLAKDIDIDKKSGKGIIRLKNDIFWSDGNKVTSRDIKFTMDMIKNSPDSIYNKNLLRIQNYKIIDEETLSISFTKPYYNLVEQLCFPIIPGHIYSLKENYIPVGTGPYKVTDYNKQKYMDLEPNSFYWKDKKPFIGKIKVIFVDDKHAFDTVFQSGAIDILHASSYDWEKYKEQKDINTIKYTSDGLELVLINHNNEILKDTEIRQALMFGINRKAIVDKHLLGHAVLTDTPVKPGSQFDDGIGIRYNYSKTESQYLLNNAGFTYVDNLKSFERELDGKKQVLRFTLITNIENNYRVKAAEDIKKYLEEAGIIIDLEIAPFEEVERVIKSKKFDLALTGVNTKTDFITYLHSLETIGSNNYGSYKNEDIDLLIDNIWADQNKTEFSLEDYRLIQEIIRKDLPFLCLFYKENALVVRNRISGSIEPDSANLFRTIANWYIVQKEEETTQKEE